MICKKKIFRVYNGYTGFSAVHRIVVADDKDCARSMVIGLGETWEAPHTITVEEVQLSSTGVEMEDYD